MSRYGKERFRVVKDAYFCKPIRTLRTSSEHTNSSAGFIGAYRAPGELRKVLFITALWVFLAICQSLYDTLVLIGAEVEVNSRNFWTTLLINASLALVSGLVGGAILVTYVQRWLRNNPYGQAVLFILLVFTLVICLVAILGFLTRASFTDSSLQHKDVIYHIGSHIRSFRFMKDYFLWLFIVFATIAGFLINDKYGPGNLRNFLMGRYFRSKREERIFMFLDLRSSTYIAQVLGEKQYFRFIKDVIQDVTPIILKYRGRIYQYVGDEITVSWRLDRGAHKLNCVLCPLEVRKFFNHRSSWYTERYGVVPDFKAGLHCGPVMVGEIGVVKRDIAYSGEVVGTASRIQKKCNALGVNLLISEDLMKHLNLENSGLDLQLKGDLVIKGKGINLPLYTLTTEQQYYSLPDLS